MTRNMTTRKSIRFSSIVEVYQSYDVLCSRLLTDEERNAIWYSSQELEMMKTEVRTISREFRFMTQQTEAKKNSTPEYSGNHQTTRRVSLTSNDMPCAGLNDDDDSSCDEFPIISKPLSETSTSAPICPRGLEARVCLERQKNKLLALRAVHEFHYRLKQKDLENQLIGKECQQPHLDSASKLAIISSKCTRWARDIAHACGKYDFEQAYPELVCETNNSYEHTPVIIRPFPDIFKKRKPSNSSSEYAEKKRRVSPSVQFTPCHPSAPVTIPIHC